MDEKSIKKLNNSNYATWKLKIELLLIKDDLWSVVIDEPVNPVPADFSKKDGQARAVIGLSVDDNQFVHLRGLTTAKAYWDRLKAVHTKSSFTAKVITLKNLCRKTLTENGGMEDHLQEIFNLIDKLSSLGEELKPNLTIALILCSLPDSYTSLINSLEARKEEDLTIDIVREKLLEEFHRRKDTKINNEVALKTNYRKNFSNSNKNCQQKGNESSQFVCKHCSQRETIDILKDSLHRAAADRDSFAACSQETISALKLALQLKEAHNQSIGSVTDRPRILKENTLSAVGTSVANGGKKPKQKKIVTTVSPIGDFSNTTERRTDTAVINTHLASVPDSLSINKNLKASLCELTMPGRRITGTLPSLDVGIKSAPSLDWYYVSRLNINTDSAGLTDYVRSNILKSDDDHVETVEMHRHIEDRTFKSFRVGVTAGGDVDF